MAEIRFRVRGPNWTETITAKEDWTVGQLLEHIKEKRQVQSFQLKYGWPLEVVDLSNKDVKISTLGLKGQNVTLVPEESAAPSSPARGPAAAPLSSGPTPTTPSFSSAAAAPPALEPARPAVKRKATDEGKDEQELFIPWPERDGYMMLRVMPDDNSCLFTAFGGVIPLADPARALREQVAKYILEHPTTYSKVVLEMEPQRYADLIQNTDKWGGGIELSILSDIYDIEICSIDVESLRVDRFGENKATRCIILYSGIHYDRIVFTLDANLPPEFDVTKWASDEDEVLAKARALARKLKDAHYYTNTASMVMRCDHPGCDWLGAGEKAAARHIKATGHVRLSEVPDN